MIAIGFAKSLPVFWFTIGLAHFKTSINNENGEFFDAFTEWASFPNSSRSSGCADFQ